jgi:hypothetical protein
MRTMSIVASPGEWLEARNRTRSPARNDHGSQ